MAEHRIKTGRYSLATMVGGMVATMFGGFALAGWSAGNLIIAGQYDDKIPMAPNTAIKFILIGICLAVYAWRPFDRLVIWLSRFIAALIVIFGLLKLIQMLTGADWGMDTLIFRTGQKIDQIPVGYQSVLTALAFLASAVSFMAILLIDGGKLWQKELAASLAAAVFLLGSIVAMGYLYNTPLLYGGTAVPMAVTTALAFISLSTGLILAAGTETWPMKPFLGVSLRARLMRIFLPLSVIAVIFESWFTVVIIHDRTDLNVAIASSLSAIILALLVGLVVLLLSKNIGNEVDGAFEARDRVEEKLRQASAYNRSLIRASLDPLVTIDASGKITDVNEATEKVTGHTSDELIGTDFSDYFTEPLKAQAVYRKVFREGIVQDYELGIIHPDGRMTPVLYNASLYTDESGNAIGAFAAARDISGRKQAEAEREQYVKFFQSSTDLMVIADPNGEFLKTNPACAQKLGYSEAELVSKPFIEFIHPDDRQKTRDEMERQQKLGSSINFENRFVCKDGSLIWLSWRAIYKEDEGLTYATARDITENREMEEALRRSEKKYRDLFQESKDAIFISTPEGRIVDINTAGLELFGFSSFDEAKKVSILDLYADPADRIRLMRILEQQGFVKNYEVPLLNRKREQVIGALTASVIRDELGRITAVRSTTRDLTRQRLLEQQLIEAQKMETLGQLAGGVAHDFNNFLTAIDGYMDLAAMTLTEDSPAVAELREARVSSARAASLVKQLLLFGRRESIDRKSVDLNALVGEMLKLLGHLIGERYLIETQLDPGLKAIYADEGLIQQILMNLAVNARDAMPEGGRLLISTSNVVEDSFIGAVDRKTALRDMVCLTISDTGAGMDEQTRMHIFEPFFTTKEKGKGTGLGLSVVYGIVTKHDGWIDVDSAPGKGTTFRIYLAAGEAISQMTGMEQIDSRDLLGRGERVLLVEDDGMIRKLVLKMLSDNGYMVEAAADAETAIDIFAREEGRFNLVFSDVVLPGMDGVKLVEDLLQRKHDLAVLLASGYSDDISMETIHQNGYRFVNKPYDLQELLRIIREELAKHE